MNENKLYTLKEIAEELRVNYRTLLSCKDRFEDFVQGIPVGRIAKYPGELTDFFKLIFALLDEGYSTGRIRDLLLNGIASEQDAFIENWLETWREALLIKRNNQGPGKNTVCVKDKQDDGMTGGQEDKMDGRIDDGMNGRMDEGTDGLMDDRMDGGTDGLMDGWMTGGTDGRMTGSTDHWMTGRTDGWTDDGMTGGQDEEMSKCLEPSPAHPDMEDLVKTKVHEFVKDVAARLETELSQSLTQSLQKMATENNIAVTAVCDAIEDIQQSIQAVDGRLARLEQELGTETEDPVDMYLIDAGDLQVSLPELTLDLALPEVYPKPEDTVPTDTDPHGLARVKASIENGKPGREAIIQWVLLKRQEDPPTSYKNLATLLNDEKIPTLTGRDAWSRSTLRNLAVREGKDSGQEK